MAAQTPEDAEVRRRICELLAINCTPAQIAVTLAMPRPNVNQTILRLRREGVLPPSTRTWRGYRHEAGGAREHIKDPKVTGRCGRCGLLEPHHCVLSIDFYARLQSRDAE